MMAVAVSIDLMMSCCGKPNNVVFLFLYFNSISTVISDVLLCNTASKDIEREDVGYFPLMALCAVLIIYICLHEPIFYIRSREMCPTSRLYRVARSCL